MKKVLLVLILGLASFIRFYHLPENPPGFFCDEACEGYNAYCISQNLRDDFGVRLPIFFRALEDWRGGGFIYSCIPAVKLFGLNESAVRGTAAAFGVLAVFLAFLLGREIANETTGLLAALFLAISPTHSFWSRTGMSSIHMVPCFSAALYFFLKGIKGNKKKTCLFISGMLFSFTTYTAFAARLFVPVFVAFLLIIYRGKLLEFKKGAVIFLIALFILGIPYARYLIFHQELMTARLKTLYKYSITKPDLPCVTKAYLSTYSYSFLFKEGDKWLRSEVPGFGLFYPFHLPFIVIGVLLLAWRRDEADKTLLTWLLLFPLPGALTGQASIARNTIICPLFSIISAIGTYSFFSFLYSRERGRDVFPARVVIFCLAVLVLAAAQVVVSNPSGWFPLAQKLTPMRIQKYAQWGLPYGNDLFPILGAALLSIAGGSIIYILARPLIPSLRYNNFLELTAKPGVKRKSMPGWFLIAAIGLSLAAEAILLWRIRSAETYSPYWAFLWIGNLLLFCVAIGVIDKRRGIKLKGNFNRKDIAWAFILSLGSLALYSADLSSWRYSMWGDHTIHYETIKGILTGNFDAPIFSEKGVFGFIPVLCHYYEALVARLWGGGYCGWRFSAALAIGASIGPFFLFLRTFVNRQPALVAAVSLATCHYYITFAHDGSCNPQVVFPTVLALLFIVLSIRKGSCFYATLSGIFAGLGFYTFYPSRLAAPLAVFAILMVRPPHAQGARRTSLLAAFLFVLGLTIAPIIVSGPQQFINNIIGTSIFDERYNLFISRKLNPQWFQHLRNNFIAMLFSPIYFKAGDHYVYGKLLDPLSSSFSIIGLVALSCTMFKCAFSFYLVSICLVTGFCTGILRPYPYPVMTSQLLAVLFFCVWIAWGIEVTLKAIAQNQQRLKSTFVILIVCAIMGFNFWKHYVTVPLRELSMDPCPLVLRLLQNTDKKVRVYYLTPPRYFLDVQTYVQALGMEDRFSFISIENEWWKYRISNLPPSSVIAVNDGNTSVEEIKKYLDENYGSYMRYQREFDPAHTNFIDTYSIIAKIPQAAESHGQGLSGEYFDSVTPAGEPVFKRICGNIDFKYSSETQKPFREPFSIRWTGHILIPEDGEYAFATQSCDGSRVFIDDRLVVDNWGAHPTQYRGMVSGDVLGKGLIDAPCITAVWNNRGKTGYRADSAKTFLQEGEHGIIVEYFSSQSGSVMKLLWQYPEGAEEVIPEDILSY